MGFTKNSMENETQPSFVTSLKSKNKKLFLKLIEVGFFERLLRPYDPTGIYVRVDVANMLLNIKRGRNNDEILSYIKNPRTRKSVILMIMTLEPTNNEMIIAEAYEYLKDKVPTHAKANYYIKNHLLDDPMFHAYFKCDGKEFNRVPDSHIQMYHGESNDMQTQRQKFKTIFDTAVKKLIDGLNDLAVYEILCKIMGSCVEAKEIRYIGKRSSTVVSSSFTTYYDYEYEVTFAFPYQTVKIEYTSSSYYTA